MRGAILLLLCSVPGFAQDARQIVLRSLDLDSRNFKLARSYTFIERSVDRALDSRGKTQSVKLETFDVTLLEGTPYTRLIARDDKSLSPAEDKKERDKLRKSIEDRRKETPEQRARRIEKWEKERKEFREPLLEIPDAFDLRIVGEELVDGKPAWVINAAPRPAYRGKTRQARVFPKMKGRLWIDKQDSVWVRAEVELLGDVSFGLFLVRLNKGAQMRFEQTRVNDEVWLPKRVDVTLAARVALVKTVRRQVEVTYKDYRKFQSDSRLIGFGPQQ